jgi:hypothetical protein
VSLTLTCRRGGGSETVSGSNKTGIGLPSPLSKRMHCCLSLWPLRNCFRRHGGSFSSCCCGVSFCRCCCMFTLCCRSGRTGVTPTNFATFTAPLSVFLTISIASRDAPCWRRPSTLHPIKAPPFSSPSQVAAPPPPLFLLRLLFPFPDCTGLNSSPFFAMYSTPG